MWDSRELFSCLFWVLTAWIYFFLCFLNIKKGSCSVFWVFIIGGQRPNCETEITIPKGNHSAYNTREVCEWRKTKKHQGNSENERVEEKNHEQTEDPGGACKEGCILKKQIYRMKTIKFEEKEMHGREDLKCNNTASRGKPERRKSGREVNKVWEKSCYSGHLFTQSVWKLLFWKSPIHISGLQKNYSEKSSLSYFHPLAYHSHCSLVDTTL